MDENPSHRSSLFALHAWRILAASGLSWAGWGLHQLVFIPSFSPDHWDWLTTDPGVIEYIQFWFRIHGIWTLANGLFVAWIAFGALKHRQPWAWWTLVYLPVHILLLTFQAWWLSFLTIPLLLLVLTALWATRRHLLPATRNGQNAGWLLLLLIGLGILYYSYDNIAVIPALAADDADRGWAWLTTDTPVIDYIQFYFRVFGLRVLAFGLFTVLTAVTGLRVGDRQAWKAMLLVPLLTAAHLPLWPWLAPLLLGVLVISGIGLWLSYPKGLRRKRAG